MGFRRVRRRHRRGLTAHRAGNGERAPCDCRGRRQCGDGRRAAFDEGPWPRLAPHHRAEYLSALARAYEPHVDETAALVTEEMGSPISYSQFGQALPGVTIINAGVKIARGYPWEEDRRGELADTVVRRTPVGVVAAIVPWNMPQQGALTKLVPALLAGRKDGIDQYVELQPLLPGARI